MTEPTIEAISIFLYLATRYADRREWWLWYALETLETEINK